MVIIATLPLLVDSAALYPARNAPSTSAKVIEVTLSAAIEASPIIANWLFGNSIASGAIAFAYSAFTVAYSSPDFKISKDTLKEFLYASFLSFKVELFFIDN